MSTRTAEKRPPLESFARGLAVIQAFGAHQPSPTLSDLSRATGLPRATIRRCVQTLVELGFAQSTGRQFSLNPKILKLGFAYLSSAPLPRLAQRYLDQISDRLNESSSVSVLEGDEVVYVARASTTRIMAVDLSVGSRLPAFCTSMGRVLLAALPQGEVRARMEKVTRQSFTPSTITGIEDLLSQLELVRRQQFAIVDQELEIGLRSIAVPVRAEGARVVGAINVSTHAARVSLEQLRGPVLQILRSAAAELSASLGS
jgi:IclR family transcriptional regulator, pca regulon regulatory protein